MPKGNFIRAFKEITSAPHTIWPRPPLNMLTHNLFRRRPKQGIFMNAVGQPDWVTDEDPAELAKIEAEKVYDFPNRLWI